MIQGFIRAVRQSFCKTLVRVSENFSLILSHDGKQLRSLRLGISALGFQCLQGFKVQCREFMCFSGFKAQGLVLLGI